MRETIKELGGVMPEDLPTPKHDLKKLEYRARVAGKKMANKTVQSKRLKAEHN